MEGRDRSTSEIQGARQLELCINKKKKKQDILFKRLNIIDACKILSSDTIRRSDFIEVYVAFEELLHCKDEL